MYPGFPLSNILESAQKDIKNAIYQPHYSVYDLCVSSLGLSLHCLDQNMKKLFSNTENIIYTDIQNLTLKSYSLFITNNPMSSLKNNIANNMHINSLYICHDSNLANLKKEDRFLVCKNAIKDKDVMCYYPKDMNRFNCDKISTHILKYCIPESLETQNINTDLIGLMCLNKELPENYLSNITDAKIENVSRIPANIEEMMNIFHKYKAVVELDVSSIINVLWAIKCGCIGIIMDPSHKLEQYKNIPNLYILSSLEDLSPLLNNMPKYNDDNGQINSMFIGLNDYKNNMMSIIEQCSKEVCLL